jgi:6-pyruvoyltetrahydropterin/6-carboxytetrahydropterin synthase
MQKYQLMVNADFCAAHFLMGYDGKCSNLHGHNWQVKLCVQGDELNEIGILVDFKVLKSLLNTILDALDHQNLNDLAPFAGINPSCEHVATHIKTEFSKVCPTPASVAWLEVWETASYGVRV